MDDHVPCPGGLPPTARKTAGRIWLGILAGCACIAAAALGWTRAHRAADDPKPAGLWVIRPGRGLPESPR